MMLSRHISIIFIFLVGLSWQSFAHVGPNPRPKKKKAASYRFDCQESRAEVDLEVNNVRARLQTGGDLFWDFEDGSYFVPKRSPESGLDQVSSIFAGAVWLGGVLPGDNPSLKIACQDYRTSGGVDFYPGPLRDSDGATEAQTCREWDRFFQVHGDSIRKHLQNVEMYKSLGQDYPASKVPKDVLLWPAIGNPYFSEFEDFELPDASQGLGNFWDSDELGERDGLYDPTQGDYPIIEIRGCIDPQFPDDMYFWVYNDAGNRHEVTEGTPIRMEVQVQAFGYKTQDEINNMTFYRYKLINRAQEPIDSTFFAMWIDPDLGCSEDDFIGCDTANSLMYVYNDDDEDGNNGCNCTVGSSIIPTYCTDIPILGIDYFRGPLSEPRKQDDGTFKRVDLGMTSFTYYNRGVSNPPPGTEDPTVPIEYYRLLNGYWKDGLPYTYGGTGYQSGNQEVRFAFSDAPNDANGWSMCTADLNFDDRRTIQATGPFRLDPGAINELIIGIIWLPEADYPCPSIDKLLAVDQTAQGLFNECFDIVEGPDAPTMCPLELDQEVVFTLVNRPSSNNYQFEYRETEPKASERQVADSQYVYEGYRIFQLANANVKATIENFNDIEKAREVLQCDIRNGITKIYNWSPVTNPYTGVDIYSPEEMVSGINEGVIHSFSVKDDAFASGEDNRLVNFKKYYFAAIAYAYNNFDTFDIDEPPLSQQTTPYIVGRNNVTEYIVVPRKTLNVNLNSLYGEGLEVTRLDGDGVINNTLIISDETREDIVRNGGTAELTWMNGGSPLNAKIYDPVNVKDGTYLLSFEDFDGDPELVTTRFRVEDVNSGEVYESETTLDVLNEELINKFGFSVFFNQGKAPGTDVFMDESNGFLGSAIEYADSDGSQWYSFVPEGSFEQFNFVKTDAVDAPDYLMDPNQVYTTQNQTGFTPFILTAFDTTDGYANENGALYSPSWFNSSAAQIRRNVDGMSNLNNVDIVYTSDKDLWSKCIVVQSANFLFEAQIPEDNRSMDLLQRPSVSKNADPNNDNLPAEADDGTVGYSYFPGYAVNVETGKRLNIFFGENTFFSPDGIGAAQPLIPQELLTGGDRAWNPNENGELEGGIENFFAGGQHYVFVTDLEYDGCELLHDSLVTASTRPIVFANIIKRNLFKFISWSGFPLMSPGESLLSYKDGLIPNDLTISLRVKSPFARKVYTDDNSGFNQYRIKIEGKQQTELNTEEVESALDLINVVPNPYYAYSVYENSATDNIVKITNLPAKCSVSIFSLDGKFIRKYDRNEQSTSKSFGNAPIPGTLFGTDIEWDLKNNAGIPISSGVYFIHIESDLGERVIKWFGVNRKFDPSAIN